MSDVDLSLRTAISRILEDDAIVSLLVGEDADGMVRVYETLAKRSEKPPVVVWQLLPIGSEPEGTYSDDESIELRHFQITSWGRGQEEAWQLRAATREALKLGDWDTFLTPFNLLKCVTRGDAASGVDPDEQWFQVPTTYRISLAR